MKKFWTCLLVLMMGGSSLLPAGAEEGFAAPAETVAPETEQGLAAQEEEWPLLLIPAGKEAKRDKKEKEAVETKPRFAGVVIMQTEEDSEPAPASAVTPAPAAEDGELLLPASVSTPKAGETELWPPAASPAPAAEDGELLLPASVSTPKAGETELWPPAASPTPAAEDGELLLPASVSTPKAGETELSSPAASPAPTPEPQHISTPKIQPGEGEKIITLSFTGDVTLGSEEVNASKENSFHGYALREGYGWFFKNMMDLFSTDDLTLVNLEGVLSDSPMMEDTRKTFRFRGYTDFARILTGSHIEACAVSNNHVMDFGRQGYESTLRTLRMHGLQFCGNEHYFVFEKEGVKIAFFALGSTYFFTYAQTVQETIAQLRREGVSAVVCCFHAGQEYASRRRDRDQERFAKIAVRDWGADLVVMHHPHVLQGIDVLNDRYVFYSLGNFCFGGNMTIRASEKDRRVRTLETMVLQMDLHFSEEGEFLGQEGRIYPCYISSSAHQVNDPNDFQPKFVNGAEARGVIDRIQYDTGFALEAMNEAEGYVPLPYLKAPARTEE